MMNQLSQSTFLVLFAANLAFVLTNLYGWLLKWFYRPKAYGEQFHELFPAQRSVGTLYLMQAMELPYLFHIGAPDALLYVNAFSVLFFAWQMLVMCEGYFFPCSKRARAGITKYASAVPTVIVLMSLLLQTLGVISLPEGYRPWAFAAVSILFAVYFGMSIRMALRIGRAVRQANENTYADSEDFPVRFAQYIQWLPTVICTHKRDEADFADREITITNGRVTADTKEQGREEVGVLQSAAVLEPSSSAGLISGLKNLSLGLSRSRRQKKTPVEKLAPAIRILLFVALFACSLAVSSTL